MGCMLIGANSGSAALPQLQSADGVIGGHEYVDLGLPSGLLWATCNVGAETPFDEGGLFAWGETVSRENEEDFDLENYKFYLGMLYRPDSSHYFWCENIGEDISGTEYDAANVLWGEGWRMPTIAEMNELLDFIADNASLSQTWVHDESGVIGMALGDRMFFPATLKTTSSEPPHYTPVHSKYAYYSSSNSPREEDSTTPHYAEQFDKALSFSKDSRMKLSLYPRFWAQVIRPVWGEKNNDDYTGTGDNNGNSGILDVVDDAQNVTIACRDGRIVVSGVAEGSAVSLYDLAGRQVFTGFVSDRGVDLPALTPGVYIATAAGKSDKVRM